MFANALTKLLIISVNDCCVFLGVDRPEQRLKSLMFTTMNCLKINSQDLIPMSSIGVGYGSKCRLSVLDRCLAETVERASDCRAARLAAAGVTILKQRRDTCVGWQRPALLAPGQVNAQADFSPHRLRARRRQLQSGRGSAACVTCGGPDTCSNCRPRKTFRFPSPAAAHRARRPPPAPAAGPPA